MLLTTKEILFFLLVLTLMISITMSNSFILQNMNLGKITMPLICFLTTMLLITLYKIGKVCQADSFEFEVSGPKKCYGYPYLTSSASPELKDYCDKLFSTQEGRCLYYSMNCPAGYSGRPTHYTRTPMSDDNWKNPMAEDPNLNYDNSAL